MKTKELVTVKLGKPQLLEKSVGHFEFCYMADGSPRSQEHYLGITWPSGYPKALLSDSIGSQIRSGPATTIGNDYVSFSQSQSNSPYGKFAEARQPEVITYVLSIDSDTGTRPKGSSHGKMSLVARPRRAVRPKKPVFRPPRFFIPRRPALSQYPMDSEGRLSDRHFRDYSRRLRRWQKRTTYANGVIADYNDLFKIKMSVYNDRLKAFVAANTSSLERVFVPGWGRAASWPENPYKKLVLIPTPGSLSRITSRTISGIPADDRSSNGYHPRSPLGSVAQGFYRQVGATPWSNPFGGKPFVASLFSLLPYPYGLRYDKGYLDVAVLDRWEDSRYYDRPFSLDFSDAYFPVESLRSLHSDILGAAIDQLEPFDARLVRKIYDKLKRNVVHVGNLIGERKQTFELLLTLYKRISKLVLLKKGILKAVSKFATSPKAYADYVLAFKFGVEPLVNDFLSLTDYLGQLPPDQPIVTVRTNTKKPLSFTRGGLSFSGMAEISYVFKMESHFPTLESLKRYGLTNPLETAWELTPWSFVVDWFLPVGSYLSSMTADTGLTFKSGTRKIKLVGVFTVGAVSGFAQNDLGLSNQSNVALKGEFAGTFIDRTVLSELPDESRMLRLKSPLSLAHGIEAIALAVQRFASKPSKPPKHKMPKFKPVKGKT